MNRARWPLGHFVPHAWRPEYARGMATPQPAIFRPHRSAMPAIAAIGPAIFDIFVAPERHTTAPTATRADIDFGEVKKFHSATILGDPSADSRKTPKVQAFYIGAPPQGSFCGV